MLSVFVNGEEIEIQKVSFPTGQKQCSWMMIGSLARRSTAGRSSVHMATSMTVRPPVWRLGPFMFVDEPLEKEVVKGLHQFGVDYVGLCQGSSSFHEFPRAASTAYFQRWEASLQDVDPFAEGEVRAANDSGTHFIAPPLPLDPYKITARVSEDRICFAGSAAFASAPSSVVRSLVDAFGEDSVRAFAMDTDPMALSIITNGVDHVNQNSAELKVSSPLA